MDRALLGHGNIETAQDDGGRALEKAHGGTGQGHEEQHGRGDGYGQSLRPAQGQRLGHQLAHHHMKVGDEGKTEDHGGHSGYMGKGLGMGLGQRQSAKPAAYDRRRQGLAQPGPANRA